MAEDANSGATELAAEQRRMLDEAQRYVDRSAAFRPGIATNPHTPMYTRLAPLFPDAFPARLVETLGITRPQDEWMNR